MIKDLLQKHKEELNTFKDKITKLNNKLDEVVADSYETKKAIFDVVRKKAKEYFDNKAYFNSKETEEFRNIIETILDYAKEVYPDRVFSCYEEVEIRDENDTST
jgi:uncharacterized coiled-coil DUF342 family protein